MSLRGGSLAGVFRCDDESGIVDTREYTVEAGDGIGSSA